jgi:hypothetical protein
MPKPKGMGNIHKFPDNLIICFGIFTILSHQGKKVNKTKQRLNNPKMGFLKRKKMKI